MRLLCAAGVFDEAGRYKYKCNAISRWLSKPGQADGFRLMCVMMSKSVSWLL